MKYSFLAVALFAFLVAVAGCSDSNPLSSQTDSRTIATSIETADSCFDLAFRDTIATIDYGAGSFTVVGRSETIIVDENTLIWGNIIVRRAMNGERYQHQYTAPEAATDGDGLRTHRRDTLLTFTNLQAGDIVEVKADIVDAATLLAVKIKVANCINFAGRCVEFEATLASVDVDLRAVTFEGLDWLGTVCPGAVLLDAAGEPITLADFAAGEPVAVKGFPLEEDELKICLMQKS